MLIQTVAEAALIRQRGFTLVEMIMVITLIAIISIGASSLFLNTDRYTTIAAREQLVATAVLAQRRALANAIAATPVNLTISQTSSDWLYSVSQGTTTFGTKEAPRSGAELAVNGASLSDGGSVTINFDTNAETGAATQFVFSAGNSHSLCISASGFAYIGNCQP
ncbi:MAG: type II secretion system protein [Pseudomonadota bacterium]|nr:type II secretion system protein [Pseudomonadota bacterium]